MKREICGSIVAIGIRAAQSMIQMSRDDLKIELLAQLDHRMQQRGRITAAAVGHRDTARGSGGHS